MAETAREPRGAGIDPGTEAEAHHLRRGVVTLPETIAQSVTVMAPAMSGAFITYLAAIKAGGATPLSFLLATLACLAIGGVVGGFALRLPSAGSLYTYTTKGLGPFWGYLTGWGYTLGFMFAGFAVLAGFSGFMSLMMGGLGAPAILQQWLLWYALGLALYFVLSYFDVRFSTRSQLVFTALTAAALLLLAVIVIGQGGAEGNTVAAFSPAAAGVNWPLVFGGLTFGILSFTGFETAAVLAEETDNPRRNIPIAVVGAVVFGGLFYLVVTYATSIGYGVAAATTEWPQSAGGLLPLSERYAPYLANWVLLAGALSALFCGLGVHNMVSRMLFAMGREQVLPRALGRTHPTHQTPHVAIVTYLGLMVALTAVVLAITSTATEEAVGATTGALAAPFYLFTEGLTVAGPAVILGYTLLALSGIAFWSRSGDANGRTRQIAVSVAALVASGVGLFGSLYYSFVEVAPGAGIPTPYRLIPWLLLAWLVLGAIVGLWIRRTRRHAWDHMGQIFE